MFLSKDEKILLLLYRIQRIRTFTLLGKYRSYEVGEKKIRKLKRKIEKLGGNSNLKISIE
jgi:hypothetical protein